MNVNKNKNFKKRLEETESRSRQMVLDLRNKLVKYGRIFSETNPDNLPLDELAAVTTKILRKIDEIDRKFGYPAHLIPTPPIAENVTSSRTNELYVGFLDWYDIIPGPGKAVYDHILKKYPKEKYQKILCVGDGIKSHLGRKLAMQGYNVVSWDPVADTNLPLDEEIIKAGGDFVAKDWFFSSKSYQTIDWADLIVGSKIPNVAEEILSVGSKPAVFTISGKPEKYNMTFKGIPIKSEKQFAKLIKQSKGVKAQEYIYNDDYKHTITVFEKSTFTKIKSQDSYEHDSR